MKSRFETCSLFLLMLWCSTVSRAADDVCTETGQKLGVKVGTGSETALYSAGGGPQTCWVSWSEQSDGIHLGLCHGRYSGFKLTLPCKDTNGWCRFESHGNQVTAELRSQSRVVIHWNAPWAAPYDGSGMHSFRSRTLVLFRENGKITGWSSRLTLIGGETLRQSCQISTGDYTQTHQP